MGPFKPQAFPHVCSSYIAHWDRVAIIPKSESAGELAPIAFVIPERKQCEQWHSKGDRLCVLYHNDGEW